PVDGAPAPLSTAPSTMMVAETTGAPTSAAATTSVASSVPDSVAPTSVAASSVEADSPHDIDPWSSIASERQYYGFLAAEALGKAPVLNYQSSRPEPAQLDALQQRPAMQRIAELYALGDRSNARREWNFLLPRLDAQTRLVAPYILADLGW